MRYSSKIWFMLFLMVGACSFNVNAQSLEQRPANGHGQNPAFAGQTRAPALNLMPPIRLKTVEDGLPQGWALALLPDETILMTIKRGGMILLNQQGELLASIKGMPAVDANGQGGLLDVVLSPDFSISRKIYFSFSEPREGGGNGTSVASAILPDKPTNRGDKLRQLEDVQVIFRQLPAWESNLHFGSRLVFDREGQLYITLGERSHPEPRLLAQDLSTTLGKVVRIGADGTHLSDNPFSQRQDAGRDIWSYGHRNIQAATLDGAGRLWTVEHGPRGGDELNQPQAGKNYGWPVITYGIDYSGVSIGGGLTAQEGMEQPVYYWDPVIAPSGMVFYQGDMFPEWKNSFLIGGLQARGLVVLKMADDHVVAEGHVGLESRVRDVRVAPDGSIYVLLEERGSSMIKHITRE